MSLAILFHFLCAQPVSDINISIIRSLRLFCWITSLVVLFLVRCVVSGYHSNPTTPKLQHTSNQEHTTNVVIQQNSRKLLMMDILMSETGWAHNKWNKIASDIELVFYSTTKCTLYKTPVRPTLVRGNECWTLSKEGGNMFRIFERRMLRIFYGPINDNSAWRTRCNNTRYMCCYALDIVKVIKIGKLRWLGHLCRIQELEPCRKLTAVRAEGAGRVGKPKMRWLGSLREDMKKIGVRKGRRE